MSTSFMQIESNPIFFSSFLARVFCLKGHNSLHQNILKQFLLLNNLFSLEPIWEKYYEGIACVVNLTHVKKQMVRKVVVNNWQ